MTASDIPRRSNLVPSAYRGVAVTEVDCHLDEASLTALLVGREAYRRTRFIVVRRGSQTAVVAVEKESTEPVFSPITSVRLLVGADDCVFLVRPEVDTAVPSRMAGVAAEDAPGARGVVVQGRYEHVSFIVDPAPLQVTVRDVVPPFPPKLVDQARRLLDVSDHLPPMVLVEEGVDLTDLARSHPAGTYLLPCRGSGVTVEGADVRFLDQRPEREPWTLIGCERSQQIHAWVYGERAEQVDMCPRRRGTEREAVLTKCCLLEDEIAVDGTQVVVPWGASLAQVAEALTVLAERLEPSWAPA